MQDAPITLQTIVAALAVFGSLAGLWFRIDSRIKSSSDELSKSIETTRRDVEALRLEVMRDYASVSHLEKVESRLISSLDRLTEEVTKLREAWAGTRAVSKADRSRSGT